MMATHLLPSTQTWYLNNVIMKAGMPSAWHCHRNNYMYNVVQTHIQRRCIIGSTILRNASISTGKLSNVEVFATSRSSVQQIEPDMDRNYDAEGPLRRSSYLFRMEVGGLVKVLVTAEGTKYAVHIEVSSLQQAIDGHDLMLSWGMYRSDSSKLYIPDTQTLASGMREGSTTERTSVKTPFTRNSSGRHTIKLEFNNNEAPFYLSFLLYSLSDAPAADFGIRTHRRTKFVVPVGIGPGCPLPLGVSTSDDGLTNFSLFSRNAEHVVLCLYDGETSQPSLEIELDPYVNRTGDIWHVSMESVEDYANYGYRCKGEPLGDQGSRFDMQRVLLDPYAKMISKFFPDQGESITLAVCLGSLDKETSFDWSGDVFPRLPMEKLVTYRLNVGQFTEDKSSGLPKSIAGSFAGVAKKLPHFKELGVNAILLEPIFPFDVQKGPYFPYHFFSPMNLYGPTGHGDSAINSVKEMVKSLHSQGIEVLLEVVFTHTSEGGDAASQTVSLRGIDNSSYYIVNGGVGSGTDNVLNCNNPVVQQMILDSLCHWVTEFHIDGFCFINSSSLVRGSDGNYLSRPPLVEAIAFEPVLSETKLIADCWSPVDMHYMEILFPHWKRWAQINTRFCSSVRNFLRGEGLLSDLATRLCGSGDLFSDSRGPAFSFNYVAKNIGLSLVDLVCYSSDDLASELSWNCGEEGPTKDRSILKLRQRQIRNFLFILFVSLGIPVLNMGDECGYSTGGSPAHSDRQPVNWDVLKTGFGMQITQFIAFLSALRRRRSDLFLRKDFWKVENINWYDCNQSVPKWEDPSCKFLAMMLKAEDCDELDSDNGDLYISFNASNLSEIATLPPLPEGTVWLRLVDTFLPFPGFFSSDSDPTVYTTVGLSSYELKPHSCALFEAKRRSADLVYLVDSVGLSTVEDL